MLRLAVFAALLAPTLGVGLAASGPDAARQPLDELGATGTGAGATAAGTGATAGGGGLATLLAEADGLYDRRDDPAAFAAHRARLEEAEKFAPGDFEVLWRLARLHFWLADDPRIDSKEKSRLGKISWDYGDRATAASPARVEGWYFAAGGVGNYALGIGILTALRQGIEGKFKERLSKAESIDPDYLNGGVQTAWGRFWFELPWPKYSPERSVKSLQAALGKNPGNVRAHVYLADVHEKEGRPEEAAAALQRAIAEVPGRYDAPEERRWQEVARRKIAGR